MKLRLTRPTTPANLLAALTLFGDELERRIAFGSATVSWPGGTPVSSVTTVTHELDGTPTSVVAVVAVDTAEAKVVACAVRNVGATTFQVLGEYVDGTNGALGQTRTVYWQAVR